MQGYKVINGFNSIGWLASSDTLRWLVLGVLEIGRGIGREETTWSDDEETIDL